MRNLIAIFCVALAFACNMESDQSSEGTMMNNDSDMPTAQMVSDTEAVTDAAVVEMSMAFQMAYINNNFDEAMSFMSDDFTTTVYNSNGTSLMDQTEDQITSGANNGWNFDEFVMSNHRVVRSADNTTMVVTFDADGSLSFDEGDKNVPYSTRASQVWVETANGWKLMHSHWSPKAESAGIPAAE